MRDFRYGLAARFLSLLLICSLTTVSFGSVANARFIQPDNWDPTLPGVGTNRYAYSDNDPVNHSDSNGHWFGVDDAIAAGVGAIGGLIGQSISDSYNGTQSSWFDYGKAATAGAAAGLAGYYSSQFATPVGGAAASGATYSAVRSALDGNAPTLGDVATGAVVGAATIGILKGAGAAARSVVGTAVSNPVSDTLARVVPRSLNPGSLAKPGDLDAFVTNAYELRGLTNSQIAAKLAIPESPGGFKVIEFPSSSIQGIASPINRTNPGFVQGGRTAGGATEFVVPNGPIPAGAFEWIPN